MVIMPVQAAMAIALAADAVSIGRPNFYALCAGGEHDVAHMLDFMREGLERTMALSGVRSLAEIDRELVRWKQWSASLRDGGGDSNGDRPCCAYFKTVRNGLTDSGSIDRQ